MDLKYNLGKDKDRRLLKAQICRGRDLSEQQKRLLSEEYRLLDKEVKRSARKERS
jgi:hypothetical protein